MRIAQVAPLTESVPPRLYGGTERVISALTEELVRLGHAVTLFASGDSKTSAKLIPMSKQALRLDPDVRDPLAYLVRMLGPIFHELGNSGEFDLIHSHLDYIAFPFTKFCRTPVIHTLHGRLDITDYASLFDTYADLNLVSISHSQRTPLARLDLNWLATVHNGIVMDNFSFNPRGGDYLVFIGRISPEKRPDLAIAVARKLGKKLIIAAKVDKADQAYYAKEIKPLIDGKLIEYIGEVNEQQKNELLGNAYANIFPIDWPEPFGLTALEAMATGTPVITRPCGALVETVIDGVTGYIRDSVDELAEAVKQVDKLDRAACRKHVEVNFSQQAMARGYLAAYQKVQAPLQAKGASEIPSFFAKLPTSLGGARKQLIK